MNYTANYHLPQWVETDRILMEDFNDMASTLDAALDGLREDVDTHAETLAGCGNCQLYSGSYVGTDTITANAHTFPGKPLLLMVADSQTGRNFVACRGMTKASPHYQSNGSISLALTWGDNTATWNYSGGTSWNFNASGTTYLGLALLEMDA